MLKSKFLKIIFSIVFLIGIIGLVYVDNKFIFQRIADASKFEKETIEIYEKN